MFTLDQIRSYTDRFGVPSYVDDDGDLHLNFAADNDFPHNVDVVVLIDNDRLSYIAFPSDYHPDNLEYKVNRANMRRNFPTAVTSKGELRMEYSFYISEDVSEEYIYDTCVRRILGSIWNAFVEFDRDDIEEE